MDKKSTDNRSNQLNPNNGSYWTSRNAPQPAPNANGSVTPAPPTSGQQQPSSPAKK